MGTLVEEYDRERKTVLRARWLMVGAVGTMLGVFLTGPLGVLRLTGGDPLGWVLVFLAGVFAGTAVLLFRGSRRLAPASKYRITADASQQADPAGTPGWARKEVGWIEKAFRLWS